MARVFFQKVDCFITIFLGNLNLILFISFQVLAFLAGLINIFHGMGWYGSFIFWSTFFISGFFLALRVFDVHAGLAAKFGWFVKAEFGYCAIWILLYIIATIYSFIFFGAAMVSISIVLMNHLYTVIYCTGNWNLGIEFCWVGN